MCLHVSTTCYSHCQAFPDALRKIHLKQRQFSVQPYYICRAKLCNFTNIMLNELSKWLPLMQSRHLVTYNFICKTDGVLSVKFADCIVLEWNLLAALYRLSEARIWQSQQQAAETCSHIPPVYITELHCCCLIMYICWISNTAALLVFFPTLNWLNIALFITQMGSLSKTPLPI
jgi:hypothetical protein